MLMAKSEPQGTIIEEVVSETTIVVEEGIKPEIQKAKEYWEELGPGLTTGASDDDPSGIATYSQIGAAFGFIPIWLTLYSLPLTIYVQEMCARIGLATGKGLAANIKILFPRWVLVLTSILLLIANTINIGVDLGAMARSVQLLMPGSSFVILLLLFTILSLSLQIFLNYRTYARYLKWLALVLISYIISTLAIKLPWHEIILNYTLVPHFAFTKQSLFLLCAFLGTTISPYLFFWQTSQEVEDKSDRLKYGDKHLSVKNEIKEMRSDVISGITLSNIVAFFIVAASAGTLFKAGITNITTATDAALALKPFAGDFAFTLFAAGIIGTGMLTVPILAGSAAYALSETFNWKFGLNQKLKNAGQFYAIIIFAMTIGMAINFLNIPIFTALIWTAVINGLVAPLIVALITIISSRADVMGRVKNGIWPKLFGWITVGVMTVVGIGAIAFLF